MSNISKKTGEKFKNRNTMFTGRKNPDDRFKFLQMLSTYLTFSYSNTKLVLGEWRLDEIILKFT